MTIRTALAIFLMVGATGVWSADMSDGNDLLRNCKAAIANADDPAGLICYSYLWGFRDAIAFREAAANTPKSEKFYCLPSDGIKNTQAAKSL